jgi:hypothetical protein
MHGTLPFSLFRFLYVVHSSKSRGWTFTLPLECAVDPNHSGPSSLSKLASISETLLVFHD